VPRIYADAARDHQAEVIAHQPRPVAFRQADVNALAARFGLPASAAAALGPDGSTLIHAKICRLDGVRTSFGLKSGNREISLYVRRNDAGARQNVPVLVARSTSMRSATPRFLGYRRGRGSRHRLPALCADRRGCFVIFRSSASGFALTRTGGFYEIHVCVATGRAWRFDRFVVSVQHH